MHRQAAQGKSQRGPAHRVTTSRSAIRRTTSGWLPAAPDAPPGDNNTLSEGIQGEPLHCALLLDYVPPEEPPSKPLGNAPRIR